MPSDTPLTGPALADKLYAAGLAPPGVRAVQAWTAHAPTFLHVHGAQSGLWQPWCDIAAVWHLVERYGLDITSEQNGWSVLSSLASRQDEIALAFAAIPAAIGRLALRLASADEVPHAY